MCGQKEPSYQNKYRGLRFVLNIWNSFKFFWVVAFKTPLATPSHIYYRTCVVLSMFCSLSSIGSADVFFSSLIANTL